MADEDEELSLAYSVEALPGHVILTTYAPLAANNIAELTLTLSIKEGIRLVAGLTDALDDATEGYDWSELDAEVNGE